jgi:hypothetical protein
MNNYSGMSIRYEFDRDAGYRFFKDGVSILLHTLGVAKTDKDFPDLDDITFYKFGSESGWTMF